MPGMVLEEVCMNTVESIGTRPTGAALGAEIERATEIQAFGLAQCA